MELARITDKNDQVKIPLFAYMCDTDIRGIEQNAEKLKECPVIIVECTYLYESHLILAKKNHHMHWNQLKLFILDNPKITFILIHFSLRYKDIQIMNFFKFHQITGNIILWLDSKIVNLSV